MKFEKIYMKIEKLKNRLKLTKLKTKRLKKSVIGFNTVWLHFSVYENI